LEGPHVWLQQVALHPTSVFGLTSPGSSLISLLLLLDRFSLLA
jgi:hypothetical protein